MNQGTVVRWLLFLAAVIVYTQCVWPPCFINNNGYGWVRWEAPQPFVELRDAWDSCLFSAPRPVDGWTRFNIQLKDGHGFVKTPAFSSNDSAEPVQLVDSNRNEQGRFEHEIRLKLSAQERYIVKPITLMELIKAPN